MKQQWLGKALKTGTSPAPVSIPLPAGNRAVGGDAALGD